MFEYCDSMAVRMYDVDASSVCTEPHFVGSGEIHGVDEAVAPGVGIGGRGEILFEIAGLFVQQVEPVGRGKGYRVFADCGYRVDERNAVGSELSRFPCLCRGISDEVTIRAAKP